MQRREGKLGHLAEFLPKLEQPGFDFGHWAGGERHEDGAITMPYFDFSAEALELIRALPVEMGFDWPAWMETDEAQRLVHDRDAIATADADELLKLTTAMVRSDRFNEGSLAGAFESGLLAAVVRRAKVLSETEPE